jgi:hypothetical protein
MLMSYLPSNLSAFINASKVCFLVSKNSSHQTSEDSDLCFLNDGTDSRVSLMKDPLQPLKKLPPKNVPKNVDRDTPVSTNHPDAPKSKSGFSKLASKPASSLQKSSSRLPKPSSGSTSQTFDKKILLECPISTKAHIFKDCSISKHNGGSSQDTIFKCHCGAPPVLMPKGQSQNVQAHWDSRLFIFFLQPDK